MHRLLRGLVTPLAAVLCSVAITGCSEPVVEVGLPDAGFLPAGDGGDQPDAGASPVVVIETPQDGTQVRVGDSVTFRGSALDASGAAVGAGGLAWTSDKDGQLGLGAEIRTGLATVGVHLVTLTATDASGASAAATIHLEVLPSTAPVVVIRQPSAGHEVSIGESVRFRCEATASAGRTVANAGYVWTSSIDGQLGIGAEVRTGLASAGEHTVTCTAADDAGQSGHAEVVIKVVANRAPRVSIDSPVDGAYVGANQTVTFSGSATDPEDGQLTGSALVWTSSISGQLGIGAQVSTALPLGDHVITLAARDTANAAGEATVTIHVVSNVPPRCEITAPADGRVFLVGESIRFLGSCSDPESGAVTGLRWTSDKDGQFGLGSPVQTALSSVGVHRVRLCAPDPVDAQIVGCVEVGIELKANTPPTCEITAPSANAVVSLGERVRLEGRVTDAEDPSLTGRQPSASWSSDRAGQLVSGATGTYTFQAGSEGLHLLTLSGTDSGGATCNAQRTVRVNTPPVVALGPPRQNGSTAQPFHAGLAIDVTATASDADDELLDLAWQDALEGPLGTALTARLAAPAVGRHLLRFTATDPAGAEGRASTTFDVLPAGATRLVEPLTAANTALGAAGGRQVQAAAVASNGTVLLGNDAQGLFTLDPSGVLVRVSGNNLPPDDVNQVLLDEAAGLVYLATKDGLMVCGYSATTGVAVATCRTFVDGNFPDRNNDLRAVAKVMGSDGATYLLVGNPDGLLVASDPAGSSTGRAFLQGMSVRGIAADGTVAWVATDRGLVRIDPVTGTTRQWRSNDGAPSDEVRAVAVGTGGTAVWVGTSSGLGRYEPATDTWTTWRTGDAPAPGLVHDTCRAVAVARVTIGGVSRDVVWVGTDGGVSRFDPSVPSFMSLTTADGLPSARVRTVSILPDGSKLFGTDLGVAKYVGP